MTVDHIRAAQSGPFECLRCGEAYTPNYPCPMGAYNALSKWFTAAHADCLPLRTVRKEQHERTS